MLSLYQLGNVAVGLLALLQLAHALPVGPQPAVISTVTTTTTGLSPAMPLLEGRQRAGEVLRVGEDRHDALAGGPGETMRRSQ